MKQKRMLCQSNKGSGKAKKKTQTPDPMQPAATKFTCQAGLPAPPSTPRITKCKARVAKMRSSQRGSPPAPQRPRPSTFSLYTPSAQSGKMLR
jgi:hypothetical protein